MLQSRRPFRAKKRTNSSGDDIPHALHWHGMVANPFTLNLTKHLLDSYNICSQFSFENLDVSNMVHQILHLFLWKGHTIDYVIYSPLVFGLCRGVPRKSSTHRDSRKMESAKWLGDEPESLGGNYRFPRWCWGWVPNPWWSWRLRLGFLNPGTACVIQGIIATQLYRDYNKQLEGSLLTNQYNEMSQGFWSLLIWVFARGLLKVMIRSLWGWLLVGFLQLVHDTCH